MAETTYTPFQTALVAAPVRLIVRRVQPTSGSQPARFAIYSYHGCITDVAREAGWLLNRPGVLGGRRHAVEYGVFGKRQGSGV